MSGVASSTRDSHTETMVKKAVRAQVGLLRDDWFLPVQADALNRALTYVGGGLPWPEASRKALEETFAAFGISGLHALLSEPTEAIEAGETA